VLPKGARNLLQKSCPQDRTDSVEIAALSVCLHLHGSNGADAYLLNSRMASAISLSSNGAGIPLKRFRVLF